MRHVDEPAADEPEPYLIPMSRDGHEVLAINRAERGGWAAYHSPMTAETGSYVLLRVGPEEGDPATPVETDGGFAMQFDPATLDGIALEVRELHVSVSPRSAGFSSQLLREIPFLRIEAAVNHPRNRDKFQDLILAPNTLVTGRPAGYKFMIRPGVVKALKRSAKVEDPGGYRKPNSFYEAVALAYLDAAILDSAPAQVLAEANGVTVGNVHRWVREARARGLLKLPTHRGKSPAE